jgi:phosphoglycolate phosphatase-like HAD superfamily hydrolase
MIKVVVLDFDGTLADTNSVKEDCLRRTVAGLPDGPAALEKARQSGGDRYRVFADIAQRLWNGAGSQVIAANTRTLIESYSDCCTKGIVAAAERRGAREALDALRRRELRRYVLSATPDRHLREVLCRRGLLPRINGALGSSVTKEQGLLKIMTKERVGRESILLVGDSADDQRAARAIGVKFAAVTAERRIDARGRFALRDLRLLVPLIDGLNGRRTPRGK